MNIFPYSNFHDLNLDWLLQQVKQLRNDVDGLIGSATPSNTTPQMDGVGAPGSSVNYSRGDHVHPTDTSRASATELADEVTARTNKDLSLDGDIAAVDAKIHFSASNPLMDGSPTAGFSTDQARADHIHPTDTSRAAAADLTQEISDRGAADITLQNNINAVDAKIVLATGAPLMDSSSATPGSSTSMARADHVHPTDTSRASATDLATLQARVDSFSGSAIASDTTPYMDGIGSAGTGANYSRGDHVHPSDTSKVSKAGDTMTGYLSIEPVERYKAVNAIGWMRIATVPRVDGTKVYFDVVRKGDIVPSETHSISLIINQNGVSFENEESSSDVIYVDAIRYSNAGKVDIHLDQNYASDVGVKIKAIAPTKALTEAIELIPFEGVSSTPDGETILETHYFFKDAPNADVSSLITWDSTTIDDYSRMNVEMRGKILILSGFLKFKTNINLRGANLATLDSKLSTKENAILTAYYHPDPNTEITKLLDCFMGSPTQLRSTINYNNGQLGNSTADNLVFLYGVLPLI